MHPLMATILLRVPRLDPLGPDPQLQPPDRQVGETAYGGGGEGDTVVGTDRLRQTELPEGGFEDRLN